MYVHVSQCTESVLCVTRGYFILWRNVIFCIYGDLVAPPQRVAAADPPLTLLVLSCKLWESEEKKKKKKRCFIYSLYSYNKKPPKKTLKCSFLPGCHLLGRGRWALSVRGSPGGPLGDDELIPDWSSAILSGRATSEEA